MVEYSLTINYDYGSKYGIDAIQFIFIPIWNNFNNKQILYHTIKNWLDDNKFNSEDWHIVYLVGGVLLTVYNLELVIPLKLRW